MQSPAPCLAAALVAALMASPMLAPARAAMSLDQACAKFSRKLNAAVASGDINQARLIDTEGTKRVASHFNGATCPNVKAP